MAAASGALQVHSHMNGEFARRPDGRVELVAGGYFDRASGEAGGLSGVCRCTGDGGIPGLHGLEVLTSRARERKARRDRIHPQPDANAFEYLSALRAAAQQEAQATTAGFQ